jgi:ABC-2 type transport system permease protein
MFTLFRIEFLKVFRKWRTYIGFIAVGVLVPLVHLAMYLEGQNSLDFITRNLQQSFLLVGNLLNGYWISYIILNVIAVHIPFLITLVAGDLLAGEATAGTYRLLIARPISRMQIIASKFLAGFAYSALLIIWLAAVSLGLGILIFGTGELLVVKSELIIIFDKSDVMWRFLLAYGFAVLGMTVVCSLAFFFSSLVENAIGPIITTMAVIIVFIIISAIDVDIFRLVRPYLFTNYILNWKDFFNDPLDHSEIIKSVLFLSSHIIVLLGITAVIFQKKDILS